MRKAFTMPRYHDHVLGLVLLTCVGGCGHSETADDSSRAAPAIESRQPREDAPTESKLLKQEMIHAAVELMKARKPDADPNELRGQVEEMSAAEIKKIRKQYPEFLIVSAETEQKLASGTPIADAAQRIVDAERTLETLVGKTPDLVKALHAEYKAGKLSPIRTELLAQLMVGTVKALEASLTK
jgi:hypothetical protein